MITRLQGRLVTKAPPHVVIDVQGVGYEVEVPMSTFCELPELKGEVTLLTHLTIREDAHLLFGFLSEGERKTFRTLIKVSGIGPKIALAVLSGMGVEEFAQAIAQQQVTRLTRIPGIGKRIAERLVVELKDKLSSDITLTGGHTTHNDAKADIANALIALGYSEREAAESAKSVPETATVADGIRFALKALSKP